MVCAMFNFMNRVVDALAARRSDVVVAVSGRLKEYLQKSVKVDAGRIRVVVNGVDTDRFRPRPPARALLTELGIPDGAPVIGSVGRLEPVKGYDVAVEALAILRNECDLDPRPVLVLGGEGSQRASLEARARELGIHDGLIITGWRDDVPGLHATFSLFTLSSHSEGTSVSLLEAMSSGLCPVVTDVGGNAAVLGPELEHRLVPSGDPAALASAWYRALKAPISRSHDGGRARDRIVRNFGLDAMVHAYEKIYEE